MLSYAEQKKKSRDDGSMSSWFKENYFEKDNVKLAMREHFNLTEDDVTRMTPKSKTKKGTTGPFE